MTVWRFKEGEGGRREAGAPDGAEKPRQDRLPGSPVAVLTVFAALRWAAGVVRLPLHTPQPVLVVVGVLAAFAMMGGCILAIAVTVRGLRGAGPALAAAVVGAAAWYVGFRFGGRGPAARSLVETVQDLGLILAGAGLGRLIAAAFREPNILAPAGAFAAFADLVVVGLGTVHRALSTPAGQAMVARVSAKAPALHPGIALPTIGPGDFLFLGIFLACAERFGMGLARNAAALTVVLSLALLAAFVLPVPALAPMSLTFLAMNWRSFRLTRQEGISTVVVLGLMGALFVGYFLLTAPHGGKR